MEQDRGSPNTKERGLKVGNLEIEGADFSVRISELPGLMSASGFRINTEIYGGGSPDEKWQDVKDKYYWSSHNITRKHYVPESISE